MRHLFTLYIASIFSISTTLAQSAYGDDHIQGDLGCTEPEVDVLAPAEDCDDPIQHVPSEVATPPLKTRQQYALPTQLPRTGVDASLISR